MMIEVYRPGTKVTVGGDKRITAFIQSVQISREDAIWYTVHYWAGFERKEATVSSQEVTAEEPICPLRIGFIPPDLITEVK